MLTYRVDDITHYMSGLGKPICNAESGKISGHFKIAVASRPARIFKAIDNGKVHIDGQEIFASMGAMTAAGEEEFSIVTLAHLAAHMVCEGQIDCVNFSILNCFFK